MAARRAMSVYDYGEASRLLERAIGVQDVLDPDDEAKRCDLLLALGEALMPGGEPQRVYEVLAPEAFALAEAMGDGIRASRAAQEALLSLYRYGVTGGTAIYRLWAERADRYAVPGTPERVYADTALSRVRSSEGRFADVIALRAQALERARLLEDPYALLEAAAGVITPAAFAPRIMEERLRLAEEFSHGPREGVSFQDLARFLHFCATVFLEHGQRQNAEALDRDLADLGLRVRDPEAILFPMLSEGVLALVDGHLEEAMALAESVESRAEELGSQLRGRRFAININFRPLLYLGQAEEALTALPSAASLASIEVGRGEITLRQAVILAHLGRPDEAAALLRGLPGVLLTPGPDGDDAPTNLLTSILESAVLSGERELAELLVKRPLPATWERRQLC